MGNTRIVSCCVCGVGQPVRKSPSSLTCGLEVSTNMLSRAAWGHCVGDQFVPGGKVSCLWRTRYCNNCNVRQLANERQQCFTTSHTDSLKLLGLVGLIKCFTCLHDFARGHHEHLLLSFRARRLP